MLDAANLGSSSRVRSRPSSEDVHLAENAAALLPPEPWDDEIVGSMDESDRRCEQARNGRALLSAVAAPALTGCEHGPELKSCYR